MVARQLLSTAGESYLKDLLNTPQNYLVPVNIRNTLVSFTVPDALAVNGGQAYSEAKAVLDNVISSANDAARLADAIAQFKQVQAFVGAYPFGERYESV